MGSDSKDAEASKSKKRPMPESLRNWKQSAPQCIAKKCIRPQKKGCLSRKCRNCCITSKVPCDFHKKEAKDMYMFMAKIKKGEPLSFDFNSRDLANRGKFRGEVDKSRYHEPFERFGDTIVIFCVEDFLEKSVFSAETLQATERKRRRTRNEFNTIETNCSKPLGPRSGSVERFCAQYIKDASIDVKGQQIIDRLKS